MRPQELAVEEFVLAGIALSAEKRLALAYSPTGALYAYAPGDRLANGVVEAVESTDVLLAPRRARCAWCCRTCLASGPEAQENGPGRGSRARTFFFGVMPRRVL